MYNQPENILEQYELEVSQITKGRGAYICETNQGMKLLKEFRGSMERAQVLAEFLKKMKEFGLSIEQIYETKEGNMLAKDEVGDSYLLKDYIKGAECSTKKTEEMKMAMHQLAIFHNASQKFVQSSPKQISIPSKSLVENYEKHNRELVKVKNYVRSRKRKNEFELKFQEQYAHYMKEATEVLCEMERLPISTEEYVFCHGDYNHHNVVHNENGWQMIHFECLNYNTSVIDIANFMRKMMEKNSWNSTLGLELLQAYEEVRVLSVNEKKLLYYVLAYPEKFWKLANHYYNSHKAWISGRMIEKLDKEIEQEKQRMVFLKNLFSIVNG